MKRRIILSSLLVVGGLSIAIAAQQQQQPKTLEVTKLKDNLYVLKALTNGGGGNTSVFITANGVVVVDSKNPGWGQPILDKIKTLTDKPVTTLINTHTHGDHVSGNVEFPANGGHHRPGEHRGEHEEDDPQQHRGGSDGADGDDLPEERQQRAAEADVQGQDDARQGRGRSRSVLLRPRPHQRRRVRPVPGAARPARRRHLLRQEHPAARRQQRRQRGGDRQQPGEGRELAQRQRTTRSSRAIRAR